MRAIFLARYGESYQSFELREAPVPKAGKGEVLIKVEASGLNFADVMARRGLYKAAPPVPCILGYDVAGTVHELGEGVTGAHIGQRVAAMTRFGGYAEYAVTRADALIPLPDEVDYVSGSSLATQALTAVYSATLATQLYPGDRVLIHAAAGGVGSYLVALAKWKGCTVYGAASPNKHPYLKEAAVDVVLDSRSRRMMHRLSERLGDDRLDVVFDNIGGKTFKKGLQLLGPAGRMVAYGAAAQNKGNSSGKLHTLRVGLGFGNQSPIGLLVRSQSLIGVNMLAIADHRPDILKSTLDEVLRLTGEGIIKPLPGTGFPAEKVAEAHDFLESRNSTGKIALRW
jgi:NADPH:quinone reductase-like Zn-dependent oxidoreductase